MAVHPSAHPVAVSGVSQEHPLSAGLRLPASVLVIVILPDLLARSWRQESPRLPSTSSSQLPPDPTDNSDQLLQGALPTPTHPPENFSYLYATSSISSSVFLCGI